MKTENNLENKSKFFAQYWGQYVGVQDEGGGSSFMYDINEATICDIKYDYLKLTPLSQITDEDAELVRLNEGYISIKYCKDFVDVHSKIGCVLSPSVDYLRSKCYSLPWMDLSVEDLVEYGWVKLKSN